MLESPTLRCSKIIKQRKQNNLPVYNGGLGENPLDPPKLLLDSLSENSDKHKYSLPNGIDDIEKELYNYYTNRGYNLDYFLLGTGLKQLLFVIISSFPGNIYQITPAWVSYKEQCTIAKKQLYNIETSFTNSYKITPNDLLQIKDEGKKLLIFNNPSNPTGVVYTEEELKELAPILINNNWIILSDEIYSNLVYSGNYTSISKYCPTNTLVGYSLSKDVSCGGYRCGWIGFPSELKEMYTIAYNYVSGIYSCICTPVQYVLLTYLRENYKLMNTYIPESRKLFLLIGEMCYTFLTINTKIRVIKPSAAWYLFLNFDNYSDLLLENGIETSDQLCEDLMNKKGVITVAGCYFSDTKLSLRYSFVDIQKVNGIYDYSRCLMGLHKINEYLNEL